jgi:hypothetical protein
MRGLRIFIDIILVILAFIAPWWIPFAIGIILLFVFRTYWELIILGLIIDTFYNAPVDRFYNVQFILTILAIISVIISIHLKARLRFFNQD